PRLYVPIAKECAGACSYCHFTKARAEGPVTNLEPELFSFVQRLGYQRLVLPCNYSANGDSPYIEELMQKTGSKVEVLINPDFPISNEKYRQRLRSFKERAVRVLLLSRPGRRFKQLYQMLIEEDFEFSVLHILDVSG